jgi:hypothetical protein
LPHGRRHVRADELLALKLEDAAERVLPALLAFTEDCE